MEQDSQRSSFQRKAAAAPISFSDAASIVSAQATEILASAPGESEPCELSGALGLVLASPILAERDQPPFPRVTRDGFAVRVQDVESGRPLRVVGELRAGEPWLPDRQALLAGEAVEIMTGAALPRGADAVLMIEHAEDAGQSPMMGGNAEGRRPRSIVPRSGRTLLVGENVVSQGKEARRGDILLKAGTRLRPEEIGLAAACGLRSVSVYSQPRVAILATGDELVEPNEARDIGPHQIYDSNSHSLAALVTQAHAVPLRQRAAPDRKKELTDRIEEGLKVSPLLLLSGGVSMGRYDLVEEALAGLGAEFLFTGVRIQPGKPVVFGRIPAASGLPPRFFFGLPGNPVSTMVTFRVFVEPFLAAISGQRDWQPRVVLASLSSEVRFKPGLTRFLPAHLDTNQPEPAVVPIKNQGSGDMAAHARANCYLIVPEDCEFLAARQTVRVLLR